MHFKSSQHFLHLKQDTVNTSLATQWKQSQVAPCFTINKCILYYSYKGNVRRVQFNLLKLTKAVYLLHREGTKKKRSARRKKFYMAYAGEQLNKRSLDLRSKEERNNSKATAVLNFYPPPPQTTEHLLTCMVFISVHAKTSKRQNVKKQLCKRFRFNLAHRGKKSIPASSVQH